MTSSRTTARTAALAITTLLVLRGVNKPSPFSSFPLRRNRRRNRFKTVHLYRDDISFESVTSVYNDNDFVSAFRMSRVAFNKLLSLVRPVWLQKLKNGRSERSQNRHVSTNIRLAITLRMLAGAKKWDMMGLWRIKRSTVDNILDEGLVVLDMVLDWPRFPSTLDELHRFGMDFKLSRKPPSPFNGCIGALDGISIKIRKPVELDAAEFYCRKGFYALAIQALVDSHYRFVFMSSLFPGSTHDSVAYRGSKLWRYIELDKKMHEDFWIVGDEAYTPTEFLITPFPSSELDDDKSAFNYFLSKLRTHVEQAFGILVAKWSILEAPLRFKVRKNNQVVSVLMRLHNFCIENRNEEDSLRHWMVRGNFRSVYNDSVSWHRNVRNERARGRASYSDGQETNGEGDESETIKVRSKKRQQLLVVVKSKGLRRPRIMQK